MLAAMYLRKSRAEQDEPVEATLSRHKDTLMEFARRNKITVAAVYEEVASGDSLSGRPQMLRLLDDLDKYEAVLCMDIDRLGRGAMREQGLIFETLRDAGALIVTPAKTYNMSDDMDDSLIGFKALFAREEYKMIRGRLKRGLMKSIEEGCYVANAPFGYRQVRINKKPTLSIDEQESEGVRQIFDLYISGMGCQSVADRLHAMGYRPHRGEKFNRTSIAKILRNPVYIGKVVWNQYTFQRPKRDGQKHVKRLKPREEWLVCDGLHDAIISPEVFEEANKMLSGKYHPPYRKPDHLENPLAGVLVCANCGKSMVRMPLYNRPHQSPVILCQTSGCCMSSAQDTVEEVFFSLLKESFADMTSSDYKKKETVNRDVIHNNITGELARINAQLDKIHELLEQGVYDIDTFLSRRDELNARIKSSNEALRASQQEPDRHIVIQRLRDVLEKYWYGTPYERNLVIKTVIARAIYTKPKGSGWSTLPTIEITKWRE